MRYFDEFTAEELDVIRPVLREVFAYARGTEALAVILKASGFFDRLETAEQMAVRNFAVWLLEMLGMNQAENMERLMKAWAEMPTKPSKQGE